MLYKDRYDAAMKLIPFLRKYKSEDCIIMAIPRGGIPIGYYLSKHYHFPVALLMAKKIGHPWNPELAIGAVSLEDYIIDDRHQIPKVYITNAIKEIRKSLLERYKTIAGSNVPGDVKGKTILIVDDGIATGNTILAAVKLIQKKQPHKIVVISPVAPADTSEKIRPFVDEFICPHQLNNFTGVGMYYLNFSEVSDEEASELLNESNRHIEPVHK